MVFLLRLAPFRGDKTKHENVPTYQRLFGEDMVELHGIRVFVGI